MAMSWYGEIATRNGAAEPLDAPSAPLGSPFELELFSDPHPVTRNPNSTTISTNREISSAKVSPPPVDDPRP
jgi:hypothetical protein